MRAASRSPLPHQALVARHCPPANLGGVNAPPAVADLLHRIQQREAIRRAARGAAFTGVIAGGVCAVTVAGLRLSGLADLAWSPSALLIPVVVAVGAGLLASRRGSADAAARRADAHLASDDLLRSVLTAPAEGFGAVVRERAQALAAKAQPQAIVPWRPWPRIALVAGAAFVLATTWWTVPVRDPFGLRAERQRLGHKVEAIARTQAETKAKVAALAQQPVQAEHSPAVEAELARLLKTFQNLDPAQPKANQTALAEAQRQAGMQFAQARAAALDPQEAAALGASDEAQRLRQALTRGEDAALVKALAEVKDLAKQLANAEPGAAAQQREQLKKKLQDLAQAAQGKEAAQAIQQALDQLAQASDPATAQQALAALADQLDLAQLQLQALGQNARDAEALREALKAIQAARSACENGQCPGGSEASLAAYKKAFEAALAKAGKGQGKGDGNGMGEGQGNGSPRPTNDAAQTGFTPERSPAALAAGQILMQWAAEGPSERGKVDDRYRTSLATVQQSASEALAKERLPPAQEEAVKRYFADLDKR